MAKPVKLEVITPSKLFYKGEVTLVMCRTFEGYEGFMADHTWACKLLDVGELCIQECGSNEFKTAAISGGYIDVKDSFIIYTDAAEWAEEIDVNRAKALKEEAENWLKQAHEDQKEIELAKHAIAKAITRMNVSGGGIRHRR
jgi:F-type H+-transporting ATPase subunit epsilon